MAQVKQVTAKKEGRLDCGHPVKPGQRFQVVRLFVCQEDTTWLMKMLETYWQRKLKIRS